MFRVYHLLAATVLPLLLAGCSDDSSPPSGPRAAPPLQAASRASATTSFRANIRGETADAYFSSLDPSGCVATDGSVFGAALALKEGPGKPVTGPLAFVSLFQYNQCTGEFLHNIAAQTGDATFEADRELAEGRLQARIPAFDFFSGAEVLVEVDVAWTAAGELASVSERSRVRQPGSWFTYSFKGKSREAGATGTVAVEGENFMPNESIFARIISGREARFEVVRTR
jgi:hypothetical protein